MLHPERQRIPNPDPELQRMLSECVVLGQRCTAQVYAERVRRQEQGEPPEAFFETPEKLAIACAGEAHLALPHRPGYEHVRLTTPPNDHWPEDAELVARHYSKAEEDAIKESLTTYCIGRATVDALWYFSACTTDITEVNVWKRAQDADESQWLHPDYAVHLELARMRLARYNSTLFYTGKKEAAAGLYNGGLPQAQALHGLLTEGELQLPSDKAA